MNFILVSAFVGRCIDCKNLHVMSNIKFANAIKYGNLECQNPRIIYCFFEKHRPFDLAHIHCSSNPRTRRFVNCICVFVTPISVILDVYDRTECKPLLRTRKIQVFLSHLYPTINLSFENFLLCCVLFFDTAQLTWGILTNVSVTFFPWHMCIVQKYCKRPHFAQP
jgi:hypothetical protein